jgi:paraquat-inducible protein B
MKIQNSERFKQEYQRFQERISSVTDEDLQRKLIDMLLRIKSQVQALDQQHDHVFLTGKVPNDISETRGELTQTRRELDRMLTSWEATIKPVPHPNEE